MSASAPHSYYPYVPSEAAAAIFAVLYTLAFVGTVVQWFRYRAWVWFVMVVAASMESIGYILRVASSKNPDSRSLYIAQFCLIVLAPVLMAASYYVVFSRIFYHVVPPAARTTKFLWVPPAFVTPIFVICDIVTLLTQLYGAVIVAGTQVTDPDAASKFSHGKQVVLIGLGLQIGCFGLFSVIAIRFHLTSKRFGKDFDQRTGAAPGEKYFAVGGLKRKLDRNWETLLWVVNLACLLVLGRTIYRICEFALGKTGYIEYHEWCAYVFDAVPMLPCVALFVYYHPGVYLPYLGFRLPKNIRSNQADYLPESVEISR